MRLVAAVGRFWWDFVVGDDWTVAVGVVAALGATAIATQAGVDAWWLLPLAVAALLARSVRAARKP